LFLFFLLTVFLFFSIPRGCSLERDFEFDAVDLVGVGNDGGGEGSVIGSIEGAVLKGLTLNTKLDEEGCEIIGVEENVNGVAIRGDGEGVGGGFEIILDLPGKVLCVSITLTMFLVTESFLEGGGLDFLLSLG